MKNIIVSIVVAMAATVAQAEIVFQTTAVETNNETLVQEVLVYETSEVTYNSISECYAQEITEVTEMYSDLTEEGIVDLVFETHTAKAVSVSVVVDFKDTNIVYAFTCGDTNMNEEEAIEFQEASVDALFEAMKIKASYTTI